MFTLLCTADACSPVACVSIITIRSLFSIKAASDWNFLARSARFPLTKPLAFQTVPVTSPFHGWGLVDLGGLGGLCCSWWLLRGWLSSLIECEDVVLSSDSEDDELSEVEMGALLSRESELARSASGVAPVWGT